MITTPRDHLSGCAGRADTPTTHNQAEIQGGEN